MVDALCAELHRIGLSLNTSKTRVFTTTPIAYLSFIELNSEMVQVVFGIETHMYLGRRLPRNFRCRAQTELSHRSQAAWATFHERKHILTDRQISISKRLKLFDAVISSTILFGLADLAITAKQRQPLMILQRRIFRFMVGKIRHNDE